MRHHIMTKFWWILTARGALGVLLGVSTFVWAISLCNRHCDTFGVSIFLRPIAVLATLLLLFGTYAFLDGAFALALGLQDFGGGRRWNSLILEGILSIGLGVWTWVSPNSGVLVLFYWIASWALVTGFLEIHQALDLTEYRERKHPYLIAGAVSIAYGLLALFFHSGGMALVWLTGGYAFLFGIPLLALGLRLRDYSRRKGGSS